MPSLLSDLRQALRSLSRTPHLSLAAIACIAIGIASTATVVSLSRATIARPLPFPDSERLLRVWASPIGEEARLDLSWIEVRELLSLPAFEAMEASVRTRLALATESGIARLRGEAVTRGYFDLLGLEAAHGRLLAAADHQPGAARVVLISHRIWSERFGEDPRVLGRALWTRSVWDDAEPTSSTVVGVLPAGFEGTVDMDESDFWIPVEHYAPQAELDNPSLHLAWAIARPHAGIGLAEVERQVAQAGERLAARHPQTDGRLTLRVEPLAESWREALRPRLALVLGGGALLLTIACANVAGLLLARQVSRRGELAMRSALGAGRLRLARSELIESLLLSAAGGLGGVVVATWSVAALARWLDFDVPSYIQLAVDGPALAASALVTLGASLLLGMLPAVRAAGSAPGEVLSSVGRGTSGERRGTRTGRWLVAAQTALAFTLLVAAALLARSTMALQDVDPGYRIENVLRVAVTLDRSQFADENAWRQALRAIRDDVEALPGVEAVAVLTQGALPPWYGPRLPAVGEDGESNEVHFHPVDERFFDLFGISIVAGRGIEATDGADRPRVAVVDESLARRLAGSPDAVLGRSLRLRTGETLSEPYRVVGVSQGVLWDGPLPVLAQPTGRVPDFYVSAWRQPGYVHSYAVATRVPPESVLPAVREVIARHAPTSPIHWVSTMEEELDAQFAGTRGLATLMTVFSGSALLLVAVGLAGLLAHQVGSRRRELGVRMALGASRRRLRQDVVVQGLTLTAIGLAAGAVAAVAVTRLWDRLLFAVPAWDAIAFAAAAALMLAVGFGASIVPARRVTHLEPLDALRVE